MRQLTTAELTEPDSVLIIPVRIWDALPRDVTDVLYGYIGRLGRIGPSASSGCDPSTGSGQATPAYRFDGVPGYVVREFEAACKRWRTGRNG